MGDVDLFERDSITGLPEPTVADSSADDAETAGAEHELTSANSAPDSDVRGTATDEARRASANLGSNADAPERGSKLSERLRNDAMAPFTTVCPPHAD